MASGLSKKVTEIEAAILLLGYFSDRLRYLQPTMGDLVESAAELGQFRDVGYLAICRERMIRGEPFPASWRTGLEQRCGALGGEEAGLLAALADTLGVTDLDSQLSALDFAREGMSHRLELARRDRDKYHKLYGTLGVLAGIAAAIILI